MANQQIEARAVVFFSPESINVFLIKLERMPL